MGIQRYDAGAGVNERANGRYVLFADHEQVAAELAKVREQYQKMFNSQNDEITRLRAEMAAKSKDVQTLVEASRAHLNGEYHDPETEGKSQYRVRRVKEAKALAEAIDSAMGEGNGR